MSMFRKEVYKYKLKNGRQPTMDDLFELEKILDTISVWKINFTVWLLFTCFFLLVIADVILSKESVIHLLPPLVCVGFFGSITTFFYCSLVDATTQIKIKGYTRRKI